MILSIKAKRHLPLLPIWLCLAVLPFARSAELPILIMAIAGFFLIMRHGPGMLTISPFKLLTHLFLLLWIPSLLSITDAVNVEQALLFSLSYPRFFLAAIYIAWVCQDRSSRNLVLNISAIILGLWIIDALYQAYVGHDLFGFTSPATRLNGPFGSNGNLKLGYMLAVFSPLLLEALRRRNRLSLFLSGFILTWVVILLSGSRASWIMMALVSLGYVVILWRQDRRACLRTMTAGFLLFSITGTMLYQYSAPFASRVNQSMGLFSGERAAVDRSLSARLPLWETGLRMFADNPVNGVGTHGFRYAYPDYAREGEPFYGSETGFSHAHQLWLEIATESGLIGLAGLLAAYGLLIQSWRRAHPEARLHSQPWALALLALLFPINTHLASFSLHTAFALWWLIALYSAALHNNKQISPDHINPGHIN